MRNSIFTFLLFNFLVFSAFGQKEMGEGHVRIEVTGANAQDEQMAAMLQMMKGSYSDFYFNYNYSLAILNMMGGMVKTTTLSNSKTGDLTLLFDALGNKSYVKSTEGERAKLTESQVPDIKIEYDEKVSEEILGYKTKKATILYPGQANMKITAYVAPEIKMSNKLIQGLESIDLDGFPLKYDIEFNGIQLIMTATEINDKVDVKVFEVSTEGHTETTLQELTKSLSGSAGGLGF